MNETCELPDKPIPPDLVRHYRQAAHDIGELFVWCVEHLHPFPPIEGEWLDEVKRRLQLPTDDMANVRGENELLREGSGDYIKQVHDETAVWEEEVAELKARIEELGRERNARYYEGLDDGKATVLAINGPAIEELRQRATAAEAKCVELERERDRLCNPTILRAVSDFDLLVRECSQCKEVHIFGFYHQLSSDQKSIDRERMVVVVTGDCKCGAKVSSEYDVFTSPDGSAARVIAKERQRVNDTQLRFMEREVELRQRATAAEDEQDKLREALLSAQAAMWDAHYGRGIDTGYAQSVDAKVRAALKEPTDA
jgi:hypothetical protein